MIEEEGARQERHGFAGGNVIEGYGEDDRGVGPSQGNETEGHPETMIESTNRP